MSGALTRWRRWIYIVVEAGGSSAGAQLFDDFMVGLIVLNVRAVRSDSVSIKPRDDPKSTSGAHASPLIESTIRVRNSSVHASVAAVVLGGEDVVTVSLVTPVADSRAENRRGPIHGNRVPAVAERFSKRASLEPASAIRRDERKAERCMRFCNRPRPIVVSSRARTSIVVRREPRFARLRRRLDLGRQCDRALRGSAGRRQQNREHPARRRVHW